MALTHGILNFSTPSTFPVVDSTQFKCPQHLKNNYVYFCLSQNCKVPICIDCQRTHTFQHQNTQTSQKYVSFSQHLRKQSETLRLLINKYKTLKPTISKQLKDKRTKYLKIINDHFDDLEKSISQIEIHSEFIQQLQSNYKEIQQGKSYFANQNIEEESIPELISNITSTEFEQFLKDNIFIKPGIQIVSNEQPRKRHQSQKAYIPKDRWVDAPEFRRFNETAPKSETKPLLTKKLSFGAKKDSDKNKQTSSIKELSPNIDNKNDNPEDIIINFKQKPIRTKAATTSVKTYNNQQTILGSIQFRQ